MLNAVMNEGGFEFNQWATYKQIQALGGQVKKGSKSTEVYFWQIGYYDNLTGRFVSPKEAKDLNPNERMADGKHRYRKTFSVKFYKVFNVGQCDGITADKMEDDVVIDNEPIEIAEQMVSAYVSKQNGFEIKHGQAGAYYNPAKDFVNMPQLETFVDADSYYKVLFHEIAHSTGHESRLNRKTLTEVAFWGDNVYAQEELVAEISAMYISGLLGLDPKDSDANSQAYIKGWCKNLADKPSECVYAMQQATKVVDYINA
jgi:antirestriction protein ArdC